MEQDVLRGRRAPELLAEPLHGQGVRLLPFEEEPLRCADGAVDGPLAAGRDEDLRRLEQLRRPLVLPARAGLLVAVELLDRFGLPGVADGGALALDDHERQAVDEHHDIGDDVLLRAEHPVLAGDEPLVALRLVEVEEPDGVALASVAAVLLQGDAVGEGGVEGLVGFGEAGGGNSGHGLDGPGEVGLGEPGVQPEEGGGESAGEDRFLEARAFGFQVFGRDVRVAEGLEQLRPRGYSARCRSFQSVDLGVMAPTPGWSPRSSGILPGDAIRCAVCNRHGLAGALVRDRGEDEAGAWLYLVVMLEFQSEVDFLMPLRIRHYVDSLHVEQWRGRRFRSTDRLAPVLPIVLYTGALAVERGAAGHRPGDAGRHGRLG